MRTDPVSKLSYGDETARLWLRDNEGKWDRFLSRYKDTEKFAIKKVMYEKNPLLAMAAVQDFMINNAKKIERMEHLMAEVKGEIWIIMGRKHGGKSATAYLMLLMAKKAGRPVCVAGPFLRVPKWCKLINNPADAPANSVTYINEAAMQFSARSSMSGTQRDALANLPAIRHSDRVFIFDTQHSKLLDINPYRVADAWIFKPEPLYAGEERHLAATLEIIRPKSFKETLVYRREWFTLITKTPLPSKYSGNPDDWSDDISKSVKPVESETEAIAQAQKLIDDGRYLGDVKSVLAMLSWPRPMWYWQKLVYTGKLYVQEFVPTVTSEPALNAQSTPSSELTPSATTGFDMGGKTNNRRGKVPTITREELLARRLNNE